MLKLKVAQIFPKVAPKIAKSVFIGKGMFFKIAPKSLYICATFETKYFTQNFRKSPNLVTLLIPEVKNALLCQVDKNVSSLCAVTFSLLSTFLTSDYNAKISFLVHIFE